MRKNILPLMLSLCVASCAGSTPNGPLPMSQRANPSASSVLSLVREKAHTGKPLAFAEFQLPDTGEAVTTDATGTTAWVLTPKAVVRVSPGGKTKSFPMPSNVSTLIGGITFGSDGALWFQGLIPDPSPLYYDDATVFRLTTTGSLSSYVVAPGNLNELDSHPWTPWDLTAGIEGKLWFTVATTHYIPSGVVGGITTSGAVGPSTSVAGARQITTGPDGNMWLTFGSYGDGDVDGFVLSVSADGSIEKTFSFSPVGNFAEGIATGPDHNLWVTFFESNTVVRLTTDGARTSYVVPTPNAFSALGPQQGRIVSGDKEMWFIESGANKIGRITMHGEITEYPIPAANLGPVGLAVSRPCGSNSTYVWFNESGPNVYKLARFTFKGNRAKCGCGNARTVSTR